MRTATYGNSANGAGQVQDQQYRIAAIEEAKIASVAAAYLLAPVNRASEDIVQRMMKAYRSREMDHDFLVGCVGELTALSDLMKKLENATLQGEIAAEKEFGNG